MYPRLGSEMRDQKPRPHRRHPERIVGALRANTALKTLKDANKIVHGKKPSARAFQNAAETAGYVFGLPMSQPAASAKFLWDVIDGDVHPKDLSDWWQGVLTGKIK